MEDIISQTKAEYRRAQDRLTLLINTTPDDKLNWSPSSTARTPVELVAHAANAVSFIFGMIDGNPFGYPGVADFDSALREDDKQYTTREQVLTVLEKNSTAFLTWLDALTPERVSSTVDLFFGEFPMAVAITFPADHMRGHTAQLEYLQTIWGDRDWHV